MNEPPLNLHRQYLAKLLYQADCARTRQTPCMWQVLSDEHKEKWLRMADHGLVCWLESEEAARIEREVNRNPLAYFQ